MNDATKAILSSFVVVCVTAWYLLLAIALPPMIQFYAVMVYGSVFGPAANGALYACSLMWAAAGIANARNQRNALLEGD